MFLFWSMEKIDDSLAVLNMGKGVLILGNAERHRKRHMKDGEMKIV